MNNTMAESFFKNGASDESFITVILSPDTILTLFLDGSSVYESSRFMIIYESCWTQ